jgi:hypothetical protein
MPRSKKSKTLSRSSREKAKDSIVNEIGAFGLRRGQEHGNLMRDYTDTPIQGRRSACQAVTR